MINLQGERCCNSCRSALAYSLHGLKFCPYEWRIRTVFGSAAAKLVCVGMSIAIATASQTRHREKPLLTAGPFLSRERYHTNSLAASESSADCRHDGQISRVCQFPSGRGGRRREGPRDEFLKFRNFACQRTQITSISLTVLPHRGACARHERGAGCGGRCSAPDERGLPAYGQVVSFWRPNAGVKSAIGSAGDGVKQAWSPGRARSKP